MQVAAAHPSVGARRALGAAIDREPGARAIGAGGLAEMYLVARDRRTAGGMDGAAQRQALFGVHDGGHVEMSQPWDRAGRAFEPLGVGDLASQHLVPAADAKHVPAAPDMRLEVYVPSLGAEISQIGDRRLAPGDQHQIGIARQRAAGFDDLDAHFGFCR